MSLDIVHMTVADVRPVGLKMFLCVIYRCIASMNKIYLSIGGIKEGKDKGEKAIVSGMRF